MYTDEQQQIIASDAPRIRVLAFAGTGKTTTLVGYARARKEKMLYVAYNKSTQMAAATAFPPNVTCRTVHSLAFAAIGKQYKHKLGSMRVGDVSDVLRLSFVQASMVLNTVTNFHNSADDRMDDRHLPPNQNKNNRMERSNVLEGAVRLWTDMQDIDKPKVPMPHDGYLKLYALTRPTIHPGGSVLFDEAQDANPTVASVIMSHPGRLILTGDPWQAIYGFRGSLDVLKELRNAETFALTQSFRFGRNIARVANHVLGYLGEKRSLVGAGQYLDGPLQIDRTRPYAFISRTNMSLIQAAIETLQPKLRSYYVGGVENIGLNMIMDGYQLYRRNPGQINDRFIRKFESLSALSEYAKEANDAEMLRLTRIVGTYSHKIPDLLHQIRALAVDDVCDAQRVFSTAHRAKGLEFDQACLADDFYELMSNGQPIPLQDVDRQEVHLHYVAATRGIEAMQPSLQLKEFVDYQERRQPPVLVPDRPHESTTQPEHEIFEEIQW